VGEVELEGYGGDVLKGRSGDAVEIFDVRECKRVDVEGDRHGECLQEEK
jgi:hypothetical protein